MDALLDETEDDMFIPEMPPPEQRTVPKSGELRLVRAILEQALEDVRAPKLRWINNPLARTSEKLTVVQQEALAWFADDAQDWPFAFLPVCEVLGLDAEAVRARVLGAVPA